MKAFTQLEFFSASSPSTEIWYLTQRIRIGLKYDRMTIGWIGNLNQTGKDDLTSAQNIGGFLRYECRLKAD